MSNMSIYGILHQLRNTAGRNDKEALLAKYDSPLLRKVLHAMYNPLIQYYIKQIPEYTPHDDDLTLDQAVDLLALLSNRTLTGTRAKEHLSDLLGKLCEEDALVIECIIKRDANAGFSEGTINRVYGKNFIPEYSLQLASSQDEKLLAKFKFPAIAQKKADAMRINAHCVQGVVSYTSRNGKNVACGTPHMDAEVAYLAELYGDDIVLDGELIGMRDGIFMERKESNGIANKAIKGTITEEECKLFKIESWDITSVDEFNAGYSAKPYTERLAFLEENLKRCQELLLIKCHVVLNADDAKALSKEYMKQGYEGIILKDANAPWEAKRSKALMKFKGEYEGDFRVVGWEYGTKKNSNRLGALIIESECGRILTNVGTGFSDKQRDEIGLEIVGSIITAKYNEIISSSGRATYKLYLPVFVEVRLDKNTANTLDELEGLKK